MADTKGTRIDSPAFHLNRVKLVEWVLDAATSPGAEWQDFAIWPDVTVQFLEVISGTPTVTFQGSLDTDPAGTPVPFPLTDQSETAISLAAVGGKWVLESPWLLRPQVAGGEARVRVKGVIGGAAGH